MHDTYSNAYFKLGCVNAEDRCKDIFLRQKVSNSAADFTADTTNGNSADRKAIRCLFLKKGSYSVSHLLYCSLWKLNRRQLAEILPIYISCFLKNKHP
jgi:hypothetical protein